LYKQTTKTNKNPLKAILLPRGGLEIFLLVFLRKDLTAHAIKVANRSFFVISVFNQMLAASSRRED
jgi:hypothetical protein